MRALVVVIYDPGRDLEPGMSKAEEQGLVEQLFAHATIDPNGGEANLSQKAFCIGLPRAM